MTKTEQIPIQHHLSINELNKRIKELEKSTRILKRLYFIRHRYEGISVEEAAKLVGISKPVAYQWQERWNMEGQNGLKPRFAGGSPSKLSNEQKEKLKILLNERKNWSTKEIKDLILKEFAVQYTHKQVLVIRKKYAPDRTKSHVHDSGLISN